MHIYTDKHKYKITQGLAEIWNFSFVPLNILQLSAVDK